MTKMGHDMLRNKGKVHEPIVVEIKSRKGKALLYRMSADPFRNLFCDPQLLINGHTRWLVKNSVGLCIHVVSKYHLTGDLLILEAQWCNQAGVSAKRSNFHCQ